MSTNVLSRGRGGQHWVKFCPPSCWMTPRTQSNRCTYLSTRNCFASTKTAKNIKNCFGNHKQGLRNRVWGRGHVPSQFLADKLTLHQLGGWLCLPHYSVPPRIFRPSDSPGWVIDDKVRINRRKVFITYTISSVASKYHYFRVGMPVFQQFYVMKL